MNKITFFMRSFILSFLIIGILFGCDSKEEKTKKDEFNTEEIKINNSKDFIKSGVSGLSNELIGGLYRFQGTKYIEHSVEEKNLLLFEGKKINNYICFGTDNQDTCLHNEDRYLYRIIGINDSGELKIVKEKGLLKKEKDVEWRNTTINKTWADETKKIKYFPDSNIYKSLNDNDFLNDDYYFENKTWKDLIKKTKWKYGAINYDDYNCNDLDYYSGEYIYSIENGWKSSISAKVGLIYLSDYYYSLTDDVYGVKKGDSSKYYFENSWMHYNGWTMDNYALSYMDSYTNIKSKCNVIIINKDGPSYSPCSKDTDGWVYKRSYYPVFYTNGVVNFNYGNGERYNPFVIEIDK